jgi:hypothetical protein
VIAARRTSSHSSPLPELSTSPVLVRDEIRPRAVRLVREPDALPEVSAGAPELWVPCQDRRVDPAAESSTCAVAAGAWIALSRPRPARSTRARAPPAPSRTASRRRRVSICRPRWGRHRHGLRPQSRPQPTHRRPGRREDEALGHESVSDFAESSLILALIACASRLMSVSHRANGGRWRRQRTPGAMPFATLRAGFSLVDPQGWQDSNPRPTVLETAALPTELHPSASAHSTGGQAGSSSSRTSARLDRSVSSAPAWASAGSPRRLIQMVGRRSSLAGTTS